MGVIISRFRRKKTTTEVLERLETDIKSIEKDGQYKEQARRRVIGYVMAYSVGLYVLFLVLYYYMYIGRSQHWLHSLLYASPLLVLPILVIFLRSAISWYYNWSLSKNRIKLNKMKAEKKKILEEVMNTETYKVAKEILDKFGSPEEQSKALTPFVPTKNIPGNAPSTPPSATPGQLRQRQLALTSTPLHSGKTPYIPINSPLYNGPRLPSDKLPRPLPEMNRSALDKVVDYLLKDGPNHRMALICSECYAHNGMSMAEEFEYVTYQCAYCGRLNPARKQRPAAPLLAGYALPAPRDRRLAPGPGGDESPVVSSGSDSEDDNNLGDTSKIPGSKRETDRPPSAEGTLKSDDENPKSEAEHPKSEEEKKED